MLESEICIVYPCSEIRLIKYVHVFKCIKDRQGVSVRNQMHVEPFDNPDVICTAILCIKYDKEM